MGWKWSASWIKKFSDEKVGETEHFEEIELKIKSNYKNQ